MASDSSGVMSAGRRFAGKSNTDSRIWTAGVVAAEVVAAVVALLLGLLVLALGPKRKWIMGVRRATREVRNIFGN